jgi:hypothetical protein
MRIPLLHADFEHGSYTKISKALRKVWPIGDLSLMQSQNVLGVLLHYNGLHDAQREATESFAIEDGSVSMAEVTSSVVKQMFLRYGIEPVSGRELVSKLHLDELAVARISAEVVMRRMLVDAAEQNLNSIETSSPAVAKVFFHDEARSLLRAGTDNDPLRVTLREIDGIPNASYLVRGERVFVFDKLVEFVGALGTRTNDPDLPDLGRKLLDAASVSPADAIALWKIMPAPYELNELASGQIAVLHKPFDAHLPEYFESKEAAQPTLTRLLMGETVGGRGDFVYRDQALVLREPLALNPDRFTMAPPVVAECAGAKGVWCRLESVKWLPGFSPVPESLFAKTRAAEAAWRYACAGMELVAGNRETDLWAAANKVDLARLNTTNGAIPEDWRDAASRLRECYPELAMLSDYTLWSMYGAYQMEYWHMNSWEPSHDGAFIFYLLGCLADPATERYSAVSTGKWFAYHWMLGNSVDEARQFACSVRSNMDSLDRLVHRISDAMTFLDNDARATDLRGRKISVLSDMHRMARSKGTKVIPVTQDLSVFAGKHFSRGIF